VLILNRGQSLVVGHDSLGQPDDGYIFYPIFDRSIFEAAWNSNISVCVAVAIIFISK
jgi:hypothetical protein